MLLNETPIRTSKNYGINNIDIESVKLPKTTKEFKGMKISGDLENVNILEVKKQNNIKYGNGTILDNQINEISNKNLQIKIDGKKEKEINIDVCFSKENDILIENLEIELEENSKSTIIFKYYANDEVEYYHNAKIKINAKTNSKLNLIILNFLNTNTNNFIAYENNLEENAKVKYKTVEFGGKNNIINYYTNLEGEKSNNEISTIYLGSGNQVIDLNYIVEVKGKECNTNIDVKGAINGNCKKHFKGTIDFKKGCQKSKGNEIENCTVLSENAKSISLPILLCTEEDIEGNHRSCNRKNRRRKNVLFND